MMNEYKLEWCYDVANYMWQHYSSDANYSPLKNY